MGYRVLVKRSAEKELAVIPVEIHDRIIETKKLRGREGYRLRRGDYRILWTVDDKSRIFLVYSVAHRREVYC